MVSPPISHIQANHCAYRSAASVRYLCERSSSALFHWPVGAGSSLAGELDLQDPFSHVLTVIQSTSHLQQARSGSCVSQNLCRNSNGALHVRIEIAAQSFQTTFSSELELSVHVQKKLVQHCTPSAFGQLLVLIRYLG